MYVSICRDFDTVAQVCNVPLEWVAASDLVEAGTQPWLDVEGGLVIALAIGSVWAFAWAIRAVAQQINSFIR